MLNDLADDSVIELTNNSDTSVYITVKAGTNNTTYKMTAIIETTLGNIYEHDIQMLVQEI